jgi:hypothetical protein
MTRICSVILAGWLLAGTALADHPAIGFRVFRTADVKQVISTAGLVGLSATNLQEKIVASGYAKPDSTVWIKTEAFQIRVKVGFSPFTRLEAGEYAYDLMWYDQKEKKDIFSLRGKVKPTKDGSLPEDWDKNEFTVVFTIENLKQ